MNKIIENLSEHDYHADSIFPDTLTISRGDAWRYHQSKCLADVWEGHPKMGATPREDTASFSEGRLWHSVLSGAPITQIDAPDWRTKAAKEQRDEAISQGRIPLLMRDAGKFSGLEKEKQRLQIEPNGLHEVSLISDEVHPGITLRCRPDYLIETETEIKIIDWKTTTDLSDRAIQRESVNYGYIFQAAFYSSIARACFSRPVSFEFVFVKKIGQLRMRKVTVDLPYVMLVMIEQMQPALETIAAALATNNWAEHQSLNLTTPVWMGGENE